MPEVQLIDDRATLERLAPDWDDLAVAAGAPRCSPGWMLPWLRHLAADDVTPRAVAVWERERLIGLAPFYIAAEAAGPVRYRLMADERSASVAPLATADRTWDVASAVADAIADADPAPAIVDLGPTPVGEHWTRALREGWASAISPVALRLEELDAATILLDGTFDDWLASRSKNFRKTIRRATGAFADAGGTVRRSTPETVEADLEAFVALHGSRFVDGDSYLLALGDRLLPWLHDVVGSATCAERVRLYVAEIDGRPIAADLSIAAGGEVACVNGGWDPAYRALSPMHVVAIRMLRDAFAAGDRRVNFGWGSLEYKRGFAPGTERIAWDALVPIGTSSPRALAAVGPKAARRALRNSARRTLSPTRLEGAKRMLARLPGRNGDRLLVAPPVLELESTAFAREASLLFEMGPVAPLVAIGAAALAAALGIVGRLRSRRVAVPCTS